MAALDKFVITQHFVDAPSMKCAFTLTRVKLQSNSDTLTVSRNVIGNNDVSVLGVAGTTPTISTVTVANDTVTVTNGTAGDDVWVVTRHSGLVNQGG